jgi:ribosomal protein L7/L12
MGGSPLVLALVIGGAAVLVMGGLAWLSTRSTDAPSSRTPAFPPPQVVIDDATRLEVTHLLTSGKKIPAIKALREATGLPLAEAKHLVDDWDRTVSAPTARADTTVPSQAEIALEAEARAVRESAGPIAAIKRVRERTGWGLAEAKAYVDRLGDA